jgi:hypothetical protein
MRKPRDYDAELKLLSDKAKLLRDRKLVQLGELTVATGADALPVEILAGALLAAVETKDTAIKEAWRKNGVAFFRRATRGAARGAGRGRGGSGSNDGGTKPLAADARAS